MDDHAIKPRTEIEELRAALDSIAAVCGCDHTDWTHPSQVVRCVQHLRDEKVEAEAAARRVGVEMRHAADLPLSMLERRSGR